METNTAEQLGSRQFCSECGRPFASADLVRFGPAAVCAECKPIYVQRMREGVSTSESVAYGGFWRRFAALVIDGILLTIVLFPIRMGMFMTGFGISAPKYGAAPLDILASAYLTWSTAISFAIGIAYQVYFISQKGATLGKMIMGVKVVTATGGAIGVGRAFGRYFACYLSGMILCIGYLMAAFDDQKRALHDHICNTRVVRD